MEQKEAEENTSLLDEENPLIEIPLMGCEDTRNTAPTSQESTPSTSAKCVTFNDLVSIRSSDKYIKEMEREGLRMNAHLDKVGVNIASDIVREIVETASESAQSVYVCQARTDCLVNDIHWPQRPSLQKLESK